MTNMKNIEAAIRKKKVVETHFRKQCITVVFVNYVVPEILEAADETCKNMGIDLIHGMKQNYPL